MPDLIGHILGKYHIVERLGQGGMAEVYKAYQPNLERYVAVKLMHTHLASEPGFIERFESEARNVAALRHPGIVQVFDFDTADDMPYMVMEFIEGITLKARLAELAERQQPPPLAEAGRIIRQIGEALTYAHQRQMIHRDVKPANVMVNREGQMILTDFGLAKLLTRPGQTATGVAVGTPSYMAPEQGLGAPSDQRADIYSLGVMLYEMVVGCLPFEADTPVAVMLKHISEPLPLPRTLRPDLPEDLERVIITSLAKDPAERYTTVGAMLADLDAALAGQALPAAPPGEVTAREAAVGPEIPIRPPDLTPLGRQVTAPRAEVSPPPEPTLSPRSRFVGREAELSHYAEKLRTRRLAILSGMPGLGKTALAAALAARAAEPSKIFWHTFHAGEGVNAMLWKVAGFLFWRGQPDLWRILQTAQQTATQPPPIEVLLDYLFQMLRGQGCVLCFDDFHFVEDDPLLAQFVKRLEPALEAGEVTLILTSRRAPALRYAEEFPPLTGLAAADVQALLAARGLALSDELVQALHTRTEGNAELLTLTADALQRGKDPARFIARLGESEHVERFLMKEVDSGLSSDEREVMKALAALLGYPATREAISAALDGRNVRRTLNDLVNRYLAAVADGDKGREYTQHALVQAFYYDALDRRERQAIHQRAGEFYEMEEPDALKAARHWQLAGDAYTERAIRQATADVWAILNRGQARGLRQVLEQFNERQASPAQWADVLLARGQVEALLGETALARQSYETALAQLAPSSESPPVRELRARACRLMGELLQEDSPGEALEWLQRGLSNLVGASMVEEAALRIRVGRILAYQGQNREAIAELESGLSFLPNRPSRLRLTALGNLGNIYEDLGDTARSLRYYEQTLDISRQLDDRWGMVAVGSNMGIVLRRMGRWAEAAAHYQAALEQAEQLGSFRQLSNVMLSLGNLLMRQGDLERAQTYLSDCLALARGKGAKAHLLYASITLAEVYVRLRQPEAAEPLLVEAEALSQETQASEALPDLFGQWALIRLAQNRPAEARAYAEKAVALARGFQAVVPEGVGLCVLGQAQWADGQREAALASFEQSLALLADRDPYEAARANVEWGKALRESGQAERGTALLTEARAMFERLGAARDLAAVDEIL